MEVLEQAWVPQEGMVEAVVEAVVEAMVEAMVEATMAAISEAVVEDPPQDMEDTKRMMLQKTRTQPHMTMMLIKNFSLLNLASEIKGLTTPDELFYTETNELSYALFCTHKFV